MARSLNSRCDFENGFFSCDLPEDAILLILKVKTKSGNHMLVEDTEKWTEKFWIWDVLEIDWSDVRITLNDNEIHLPRSVIIPFREKYRARKLLRKHPLLFYIMLKQGKTWFSLVSEPISPSIAIDNN